MNTGVETTIEDGIATIVLARPETLNAPTVR